MERRSMQKTLFIHIGSPKTGTTALQNFFACNEGLLRKRGICYPRYKRYRVVNNHLYFSHLVIKAGTKRKHRITPSDWQKAEKRTIAYVKKVVREAGTCNSILLSGEEMFFAADLQVLRRIREITPTVKIVVYLRRQDHFVESIYLQHFKNGKIREDIREHKYLNDEFWLDYYSRVHAWVEIFGTESIILRPFEKDQFYGANLYADFMHHVFQRELTTEFVFPARDRGNPRVDADIYGMIKMINALEIPRKQIRHILKRLPGYPEDRSKHSVSLLSPRERVEIIERFEEKNRMLAEAFLGRRDGKLFMSPKPDPDAVWSPPTGLPAEKVAKIMMWLYLCEKRESSLRFRVRHLFSKFSSPPDH